MNRAWDNQLDNMLDDLQVHNMYMIRLNKVYSITWSYRLHDEIYVHFSHRIFEKQKQVANSRPYSDSTITYYS